MTVLDVHEKPTRPPLKKLKKFTTKAPVTSQFKTTQLVTISPTSTKSLPLPTRNSILPTSSIARFTNQTVFRKKPTGNAQKKQKTTKAPVTTQFETASNIVQVTKTKNTSLPKKNSTTSLNTKSVKQILSKQKSTGSSQKKMKTFTTKAPVTSQLEISPHMTSNIASIIDKTNSLSISKSTLLTTANVAPVNKTLSQQKPTRSPQKQPKTFMTEALVTNPPETTPCTASSIALITKNETTSVPLRKSTSPIGPTQNHMNQTLSNQNPIRPLRKQLKNFTTSAPVTSPPETTPLAALNTALITKKKTTSLTIKEATLPTTSLKTNYTKQTFSKQKPQRQVKKITQMKAKTSVRHPNLRVALKINLLNKKKKVTAKRPYKQPPKPRVVKSKMTKKVEKGAMKSVKVKTIKMQADSTKTKG